LSTANVDAYRETLWKTRARIFSIKHLAQRDETLLSKGCSD